MDKKVFKNLDSPEFHGILLDVGLGRSMTTTQALGDFKMDTGNKILGMSLGCAGLVVAGILLVAGTAVVWIISKPVAVIDKVTDPDRMIHSYEWFFETKARVEATDIQIQVKEAEIKSFVDTLPENRHDWSDEDRRELARKKVELSGLQQYRAGMVSEYNAKAQEATRSFLRSKHLPEELR